MLSRDEAERAQERGRERERERGRGGRASGRDEDGRRRRSKRLGTQQIGEGRRDSVMSEAP